MVEKISDKKTSLDESVRKNIGEGIIKSMSGFVEAFSQSQKRLSRELDININQAKRNLGEMFKSKIDDSELLPNLLNFKDYLEKSGESIEQFGKSANLTEEQVKSLGAKFIKVDDIDPVKNTIKRIIEYTCNTTMVVLFNPYGRYDDVKQTKSNRDEYVENEKGLIWQGLSDDNTAHVWDFDQYEFNNLAISLDSLRRMHINERGDVALVSRHLTYSLGRDICYGKWGEGSYTSGRPSGGYRCSSSTTKGGQHSTRLARASQLTANGP